MQELKNSFGRVFLTIEKSQRNKWIYVNWMGYLTAENIKAGALAYTEELAKSGFTCVLNDTRLILGSWDHSLDWVVNDWGPRAAHAGLKHFAMIVTPETFAESTASNFYSQLKAFEAKLFDEKSKAEEWLSQYSLTSRPNIQASK